MSATAVLAASLVRFQTERRAANDDALKHFVRKGLSGRATKVCVIADSGLEGNTSGDPGTDDAVSLLVADLNTRYAGTVTKSNRANSGYTAARMVTEQLPLVLADVPDLVIISSGHNDIVSDITTPGDGYPREAAMAAFEHMIRTIRVRYPLCGVIVLSAWPYASGSSSNPPLQVFNSLVEEVARHNGAAFVNGYQPFIDQGDYSTFITGSHPNSAGHNLIYQALADAIPTDFRGGMDQIVVPVEPLRPLRFDRRNTQKVTVAGSIVNTNKFRVVGTWAGTSPYESSTATNEIRGVFIGSEIMLRLRGAGVCHVDIDGVRVASSLALDATQRRIPFTGLVPGLHGFRVTVVSGTVGFYGFDSPYTPVEYFSEADARVTYSGTWAADDETNLYSNTRQTSTVAGSYFEVDFVGTGLSMLWFRRTSLNAIITIDGVAASAANIGSGGVSDAYGGTVLATGLTYGRHTVRMAIASGGGSNSVILGGLAVENSSRHLAPSRFEGVAKPTSVVLFPTPFATVPVVSFPALATDGTAFHATSVTAAGFTMAGTAAEYGRWVVEGDRVTY